jgi:hypothetical protein
MAERKGNRHKATIRKQKAPPLLLIVALCLLPVAFSGWSGSRQLGQTSAEVCR